MSGASRRRQSSSDDEGGGANWMDTYGDLVTLLLCFFVLLFSFSSIDSQKWESLAGAFSGSTAINIPILDPSMALQNPIELIVTTENEEDESLDPTTQQKLMSVDERLLELYENVSEFVEEHELGASVYVDFSQYTVIVRFEDNIFFNSGDAAIRKESEPVLDHLVTLFLETEDLYEMIRIEGHTDNVPIHTVKYDSNWELSGGRSMSTIRYFIEHGNLDPAKISGVGYGEYHPIASNDTVEGRASNRRVDFVIEGQNVR